jgi:hypothetical protein
VPIDTMKRVRNPIQHCYRVIIAVEIAHKQRVDHSLYSGGKRGVFVLLRIPHEITRNLATH